MNNEAMAKSLALDLEACLSNIETLGALVAAAHLEAAIEALCREYGLKRKASDTD